MKGKFQFQDGFVYKMPAHFGGYQFYPVRVKYNDITNIVIQYETKPEVLLQYIPEEFDLLKPLVNVQYSNCRDVDWMAGGEYRLIQVTAPVKYTGSSEGLTGEYALVVWENKTCPIIGGREEDGVPKIFADIANERYLNDHWFTTASYESNTFLKMDFYKKAELAKADIEKLNENPKINLFGWRYLPNLGKGGATLSHATLYPQEATFIQGWIGDGNIQWNQLVKEENPMQWHIIKALAELPIVRYANAMILKGSAQLNVGDSKILP